MEMNHFSHHHPLVLVDQETGTEEIPKIYCSACEEAVEGSSYKCGKFGFFLHKKCAELPGEINHPLHHQHSLVLSNKSPYGHASKFYCDLCYRSIKGFTYHCYSCKFDLNIKCAIHPQFVTGDFQKCHHFSHNHPLIYVENIDFANESGDVCKGCRNPVSTPFCCCLECSFFLHKKCAQELPYEINHPTHQKHPLTLLDKLPELPHQEECPCLSCLTSGPKGFVYYCSICKFGIPIRYTFIHEHPLVVVEERSTDESAKTLCSRCKEPVQDSSYYSCGKCRFFIHKQCAELPLEVCHPFHLQHPLVLYNGRPKKCNVYRKKIRFSYRCTSCDFDLAIRCVMHLRFVTGDFRNLQHFSHGHPLIFVEDIDIKLSKEDVCSGCEDPLSSPFYCCPNCRFYLRRKCAQELPLEINHPTHWRHPLILMAKPPPHEEECSCYLCTMSYKGFVYYCSLCEFGFRAADAFLQTITAKIHREHPLIPFPTANPFICNACGTDGDIDLVFLTHVLNAA